MELREHQQDALSEMRNGCILYGDVGSGKTLTAIAYSKEREPDKKLYVITTAMKRDTGDWTREAAAYGLDVDSMVVDSWNKISEYVGVEGAFFIFDEQRLVGSGAWVKAFLKIVKVNNWILLSGTPGDTPMDYIPVFVANGFYKNRTDFIRQHVVYSPYSKFPKIERYLGSATIKKHRDAIMVRMTDSRRTIRKQNVISVDYNKEQLSQVSKDRWNVFLEKPIRNMSEMFLAMRRVVNSDTSRLLALREIFDEHPKVVVFYNFNFELDMLREFCQLYGRSYSERNGKVKDPLPEGKAWVYLVQYQAGSEGWNCTTTDTLVFYSLNYSYRTFEQSCGRIDRINTPYTFLNYYVLLSKSPIDSHIWRALSKKEDFNERKSGLFDGQN